MPRESLLPVDRFAKTERDPRRVGVLLADNGVEGTGFHLQRAAEKCKE